MQEVDSTQCKKDPPSQDPQGQTAPRGLAEISRRYQGWGAWLLAAYPEFLQKHRSLGPAGEAPSQQNSERPGIHLFTRARQS